MHDTVLKKSALNNIFNYLWESKYNFSVICNKMYNNINVKTIDLKNRLQSNNIGS